MILLQVGLASALWCFFHSLFVSHLWRDYVRRSFPSGHVFARILYVIFSTLTLGLLLIWARTLPQTVVWTWSGGWFWVRWGGLGLAGVLFVSGARSFDNRAFLGIRQVGRYFSGGQHEDPPFKTDGILGVIRHPWYSGTILFLVFCLPLTDVNLVWRSLFIVYTAIGTELEERKLVGDLGGVYEGYMKRVPRFVPWKLG